MRLDLSSQITLERIPARYYKPENSYERYTQTRLEKVETDIFESVAIASKKVADDIALGIRAKQENDEPFVLGLPGGNTPLMIYKELIRQHKEENLSFENVVIFTTYEFYSIEEGLFYNLSTLKETFLNHIDVKAENINYPNVLVAKEDIIACCADYEEKLNSCGGFDYLLLGIGRGGNLAVNASGSNFYSRTRLVLIEGSTRKDLVSIFGSLSKVPKSAITLGLSSILKSKKISLVAWGEDKSKSIVKMVEGLVTDQLPASILQTHQNTKVFLDLDAASELTRINHPWLVTSCEWTNKLIRRAIVWLCGVVRKPILKLTNKDYNDNGLSELLAIYGSAYNVNIFVFNELQHTITGWPGGKPNADDTNRPERANPYPKKVIIFSPHPDDDVISMGGTFQRLVKQGHDVRVAYQTSGNIAVGDEEIIRYVSFIDEVLDKFDPNNEVLRAKNREIKDYLMTQKGKDDFDTPDILYMKGRLRREEAASGCRYVGLTEDKITYLDLPFYETGKIQKNPISEVDVEIVKKYIQEVKPHQIFVAGDLADPHGTHKVCLDAILAAIDEMKGEKWLEECRIWMYRGAWQEWEIDHIEMAVPISPEELRQKRNAILKHQSQMESAPFLGDDERLFWQRSEDRNKATAELYDSLGLASYEAIEAFVEYKPL